MRRLTPDALEQLWDATNADNKTRIKFGGGFYCGMITVEDKKYYTFNAFFMRSALGLGSRLRVRLTLENKYYFHAECVSTTSGRLT